MQKTNEAAQLPSGRMPLPDNDAHKVPNVSGVSDVPDVPDVPYSGPTYYGKPVVKPSLYGWLVWSYIYIAGLSGGSQIIATIASMTKGSRWSGVVRNGRYFSVIGSAIGTILLIADLHTPQRFYNMLRIFRKTSPMSIGSYILTSFSLTSAITAADQWFARRKPGWLHRWGKMAQIPAAVSGAGMCSYTGALLSATSTPMWAATPRLLSARFASSAMATAAAALSLAEHLGGRRSNSRVLDRIACLATIADAGLSIAMNQQHRRQGVATELHKPGRLAAQYHLASAAAHVLPLACYGADSIRPTRSGKLSIVAALGILGGGLLMRATIMNAGNRSASQPRDYLSLTQPRQQRDVDRHLMH